MAIGQINPTRMELTKLKNQLAVTRRGHRLLKDKQDEMIRQFLLIVEQTKDLHNEVEKTVVMAMRIFKRGRVKISESELYELTSVPVIDWTLSATKISSLSIESPQLEIDIKSEMSLPYALSSMPQEFDGAFLLGVAFLPKLIKLAQYEKLTEMFSNEIEKTRRRVNAIEFIMIPELVATIKDIRTKLSDQEMASTIRVMKSKEIILKKTRANRK